MIDPVAAYRETDAARRGVGFDRSTEGLLVQDELALDGSLPVWWFMHTRASVETDGASATLAAADGDAAVRARLLAPEGAIFETRAASPLPSSPDPDGQMSNDGVRKLSVGLEGVTETTIAVHLAPVTDGAAPAAPSVVPLADWTVDHVAGGE